MAFEHLTDIPLEKAKTEYMELLIKNGMAPRTESVPVAEANGRVTAGPVYARICSPYNNVSAMEGVALDAELTSGAGEKTPVTLAAGQYVPVSTGDPLPAGRNAVIMIEDVVKVPAGAVGGELREEIREGEPRETGDGDKEGSRVNDTITINKPAAPWQHIRRIGEDICAGEMILPSFSTVTPSAIGAIIAGGISSLSVIKKPVAGIIPTGDMHIPPENCPEMEDAAAHNAAAHNPAMISAMLRGWGAEVISYPAVGGGLSEICGALETALSECDIVILNAGAPAGRAENTAEAIAENGAVMCRGLAIKPGRTAVLGYSGPKPVLGVPGYPVSSIIVIEQILRPIIEYLCRRTPEVDRYTDAVLSKPIVSALKYQEFVRVRMGYVKEQLIASPLGRGSGIVTSFMKADGIVEVPQGVGSYESGEKVRVRILRSEGELRRSLVAIGSHDPLLDELSELLRVGYGDISMGSAHVGSMGGLIAVRRGEAHIAGTHLLDEETGEYNISFIKKILPKGGVKLIECVKRTQGLMLAKGNPKNITGVAGLAGEGLRYINRQKGSGTRILIDYLCRLNGVDTSEIDGYSREEYTHTSVAALIAAGSADAGLGIYSAAKLYDLDFLPVCREQYDLLIPDHAWELLTVQRLLEVLKSAAFRQKLEAMGGYVIENPGTVRFES